MALGLVHGSWFIFHAALKAVHGSLLLPAKHTTGYAWGDAVNNHLPLLPLLPLFPLLLNDSIIRPPWMYTMYPMSAAAMSMHAII